MTKTASGCRRSHLVVSPVNKGLENLLNTAVDIAKRLEAQESSPRCYWMTGMTVRGSNSSPPRRYPLSCHRGQESYRRHC